MYVASEAIRLMLKNKNPQFTPDEAAALNNYKGKVDKATKFIPTWVKVAVALALGMGTMVGWKRIVVTVGEKIGKEHLTYAQGATAELVAMGTIFAADNFGLPVSTTHVLSSGIAGTMAANRSGLQMSTIRNIAAAWVFTLPAAPRCSQACCLPCSVRFPTNPTCKPPAYGDRLRPVPFFFCTDFLTLPSRQAFGASGTITKVLIAA